MNTYRIGITLELDAVNDRAAKRLGQIVGRDIERSRRRAGQPGAQGVTHAWLDRRASLVALSDIDWCEHSNVPRSECVGCLNDHDERTETDDRELDARREDGR